MMAEDFDVEAMLEAPFKENKERSSEREKERSPKRESKERKSSRSHDRTRKRSRSRSKDKESRRKRSRSRDAKRESKRRSQSRSRDRERDRHRRRSPPRQERWGRRGRYGRSRSRSPRRQDLAPEERDQRTVFCMQLAARINSRDIEEFFSSVGKVREVRLIMDNKTRRHKGICYIEFQEVNSVSLALGLNGQKLCGVPIIIQPTQAEKNRAAASAAALQRGITGPMRLYVGSLHFNITEDMLRGIFEPFGRIEKIELMRDPENNRSKGYGFITFFDAEDAKKALDQLNGFELAGRPMKVNHVTERSDQSSTFQNSQGSSQLDTDDLDRAGGIDLGTTGRLQLMAKLAEGTGIQLPQAAMNALNMGQAVAAMPPSVVQSAAAAASNGAAASTVATQTFILTNMFDSATETSSDWADEITNDVVEECRKSGGALHVYVDRQSQGNVYVKCSSVAAATGCVGSLHGRWFSGRMVTAAYVPVAHYHNLFPDAVASTTIL